MRKIFAVAAAMAVVLGTVSSVDARGGCGLGRHRAPNDDCVPNGGAEVIVAPNGGGVAVVATPEIGGFVVGRGYWDGHRYWEHHELFHGHWRFR